MIKNNFDKAIFAAGCFWHIQFEFSKIKGVIKTRAGYSGGELKNPTYEQVSTGKTGHVESVEIEYDPTKVDYNELLKRFFEIHDPTTVDRQGPDFGSQYNSVIFYFNESQKMKAEKYKEKLSEKGLKIATKILGAKEFYPAEEYHQDYFIKNNRRTCNIK